MAGLRRTGQFLVIALIPGMLTGCAGSGSRVARLFHKTPTDTAEQTWAQAQQYEKDGRLEAAQQLYAQLHRLHPESPRYAHRLGVVSTILADHERASLAYEQARALDPNNAELLADMGSAQFVQRNYVEAEKLLRASLALHPDNPPAQCNLALAVGMQRRDEECLALFREIRNLDETELLCHLGFLKAERGEKVTAAKLYERALSIDPSLTKAATALAQLKSASNSSNLSADRKEYPQYAYGNSPKWAEPQTIADVDAVEIAAAQPAEESVAESPEVKLAARNEDNEPGEAEAADELSAAESPAKSLTGWTEEESDLDGSPAVREFPEEMAEPNLAESLPADEEPVPTEEVSAPTETAATEDAPFTEVVEQSAAAAAEPAVIEDDLANAFEIPEEPAAPLEAAQPAGPEPFSPEWLQSRLDQIADRYGQTGLMGFCPVALTDELQLVDARVEFTSQHQSQTYEFSSQEALEKFQANPDRYLPVAGGLDVVAVSQGTAVAQGSLENALWFRHKLYLFMSRENLNTFRTQARQFAIQQ